MPSNRDNRVVIAVGMILLAVGIFFLYSAWDYAHNNPMRVFFPDSGLLLSPAALGLLSSSIGLASVVAGLKDREVDLLAAAGILTLVATLLTFVVLITVLILPSSVGSYSCWGGCIPYAISAIEIVSVFGFVIGYVASVFLLSGRYHVAVVFGTGLLLLASLLNILFYTDSWGNSASVVVPSCIIAAGLVIMEKTKTSETTVSTPQFQAPTPNLPKRSINWAIVATSLLLISTLVAGFYLSNPPPLPISRCPPSESLPNYNATFGANAGHVTFELVSMDTVSITFVQASAQGGGITGSVTVSLSSGNILPAYGTLSLNVTFLGVTFQNGTRYDFTLVSACGGKFPTAAIK